MSNSKSEPFIELNRRFRKLEQKAKAEEAAVESYTIDLFRHDDSFDWDKLLKESRVVVLGEPGSGKSWELRERVRLLTNGGSSAFFIRLDQLVERDLETLFDAEEQARLSKWIKGGQTAYFFLDSVDEAKFGKVSDFHAALQRFHHAIGSAPLARAKIFLSSRISEWQPLTDEFLFRQLFQLPPTETRVGDGQSKTEISKDFPLVVCLEPLNRAQVERLAHAKSVSDVPQFIKALDAAFAWEFARRPLDVADLIGFWKENRRIGSLTEIIEFDVSSKLRARSGRVEFALSDEKKREGIEWLAAASVLSRKFSFCVPEDGSTDVNSLNPLACVPAHWREDEVRALLNRAIFDSAVYGRLRFHHRRVGEYLAAKWIAARMEGGCPPLELERILTDTVRGRKVLRPALRPIAAWLCHGNDRWNEFVRALVLQTDPKIHLSYGDPANLSIEYRRQILNKLADLSKNRKRMWIDSSSECLARIANPAISPDIAAFILNRDFSDDFREALLGIVQHGRLVGCVDAAISVINAPNDSVEVKSYAVRAVGAMEDPQILARLYQAINSLQSIPNHLCTSAIQALYPKTISSGEFVQLLAKIEAVREFGVDLPYFLKAHLQSVLTAQEAGVLLRLLLDLAQSAPLYVKGETTLPVSDKFWWIGKIIPTVAEILLEKNCLEEAEIETSSRALQFLGHFRERWGFDREDVGELNKKTISHPDVRQNYLWHMAAEFRGEQKKEPTMAIEICGYYEVVKFLPEDFHWLIIAAQSQTDSNDQALAFRLAIEIWDASGRKAGQRWHLWRATRGNAVLRGVFRQSVYTSPFFPFKRFWWVNVRHKYGKWWWERKCDFVKQCWHWLRGQYVLLTHLQSLRSGKALGWLERLLHEAHDKDHSDRWATKSWSGLEKKRGKLITNAVKHGCVKVWRDYSPPLPHEKPEQNRTSIGVLVGLTGLQIELGENSVALSKLTDEEAKLAVRYAVDELNGFPSWLENLAIVHQKAVSEVLCKCIEAEWQFPVDHKDTHEVLNKIAWHGENLIPLVQEKLVSLLEAGDPQNYSIFRFTLSVLMRHPNPPLQHLVELAAQRIAVTTDVGVMVLWLSVWMQIDSNAAIKRLQTLLKNSSSAKEIVERLCSVLSGEEMQRGPVAKNPSYLQPSSLRQFIPIVYDHVKFSDDINRADGGAYTPTARDHAQRFRSFLLDYLAKAEAFEATDYLRELADESAMSFVRDWILNLLDQRLEKEADLEPWTAADIREFAANNEVVPKNDKELFSIARKRLQILKWDVEESDNSLRDEIQKDAREIHLRRWIQRKLNERSQNRYTVPQEEEIDQQERPDLRLENPKTNPVSIEVKWADNWTLEQLLERLENQLVGQYLRAHNSRYGIYVLGYIGNKQHWEDSTMNRRLTFVEMTEIIRQRSYHLMQTNPKIAGLEIVGVNFCEPIG